METLEGLSVSEKASELATHLLAERPSAALIIFEARLDPETHEAQFCIKSFNGALKALLDVAAVRDPDPNKLFVLAPVFRSADTAALFTASLQRFFAMAYAGLHGHILFGSSSGLMVSRAGRPKLVLKDLWVAHRNGPRCEFVCCEQQLPDNYELTADLHPAYALPVPVAKRRSESPTPPADAKELSWTREDSFKARFPASPQDFECANCGTHETCQRRRGPHGPGTLCNRCGLQWKKKMQRTAASMAEGTRLRMIPA